VLAAGGREPVTDAGADEGGEAVASPDDGGREQGEGLVLVGVLPVTSADRAVDLDVDARVTQRAPGA
jgi:hypothetical protein